MGSKESTIYKLAGIIAAVLILISSVALYYISQSWQSVYPVLGEGKLSLPVPTEIAMLLTEIPSLIILSAISIMFMMLASHWKKPIPHSTMLILLVVLVWFGCFFIINWGLALPFIYIEVTL